MKRKGFIKRLTAILVALLIAISALPGIEIIRAVDITATEHVSDTATHNLWKDVFLQSDLSTENAGGIWVDKSVFDASADFDGRTVTLDDEDNFLVALSAIASTKSITGYSYTPTDTVLVLDMSGSMFNNIESMEAAQNSRAAKLAEAANEAIRSLLENNQHNRVGVVLYSSAGSVFLPVERYYAQDGSYVKLDIEEHEQTYDTNGRWPGGVVTYISYTAHLSVGDNLKRVNDNGSMTDVDIDSVQVVGGTYVQAGMETARKLLTDMDTVVEGGSFQAGVTRMPIVVLMSDGAATYGTASFTNVANGTVGGSGNGNGNAAIAFVNQLTAIYTMKTIEEHYGRDALLYTLGVGVNNTTYAQSILNPSRSTATDDLWSVYDGLSTTGWGRTMSLEFEEDGNEQTLRKYVPQNGGFNISSADKNYVDRYFSASTSSDITNAFQSIVDQIIIQSRYYPTYVTTGDHHLDGDITFKDEIGRFMEVKEIKGVLLGNVLFSGEAVAKALNENQLGTIASPTPLGDELARSVQKRIGVDIQTAQFLIDQAYNSGQLYYDEQTGDFSNYIGWYADAEGDYVGFWNGNANATPPTNAKYINRSYGFLGVTGTGVLASDMMYLSVQVHTNIENGHSAVIFKIPSALIPLITYEVSLEGTSYENATNIEVVRKDTYPIRLVYEVGLRSDINELNVRDIVDPSGYPYVDAQTGEYSFYTNRWVQDTHIHEEHHPSEHTNAIAYYQPSEENERYYYNEDTLIYSDTNGTLYTGSTNPAETSGTYYRAYYVFSTAGREARYEEIFRDNSDTASSTIHKAQRYDDGTGRWYIPKGYIHRTVGSFYTAKSSADNNSGTYDFVRNPVVGYHEGEYYATAFLGNNGLLKIVPAQGIKLSKAIDATPVPGTNTEFTFNIVSNDATESGRYEVIRYNASGVETEESISFANGEASITLNNGDEAYIIGLEAGDTFTITEAEHDDYKLVSVNGNTEAEQAQITVEEYVISDAAFVNTYIPKGFLIVSKTIEHNLGDDYVIDGSVKFDISVALGDELAREDFEATLEKADGTTAETTVTSDATGNIKLSLAHGENIAIAGIPAGTAYAVTEADYSSIGFRASITGAEGTIASDENATVAVVNTYTPANADTSVLTHIGTKAISGRDWLATDSFEFVLEKFNGTGYDKLGGNVIADYDDVTNEIAGFSFDLSGEVYDKPGQYQYRITEADGSIGGMSYSKAEFVFIVTVTDSSMTDGALEISSVASSSATVTQTDNGWEIATPFVNTYKATGGATVGLSVTKSIENDDGTANTELSLAGYQFGIFDENNQLIDTLTTDENGIAQGERTYTTDAIDEEYIYTIREINTGVPGIIYSDAEYAFAVTVVDNYDGTISADILPLAQPLATQTVPSIDIAFVNVYKPAAIVLEGTKNLENRQPRAGEFEFEVYEGTERVATGTNDSNGRIYFTEIDYHEVGEYVYTVIEVEGENDTITYDTETVITVKVNVTTAADGSLVAAIASDSEPIVFNNTYTPNKTSIVVTGTKALTGRDIASGEFGFVIFDAQGDVAATGTNDGYNISFEEIEFAEAGTYTYLVAEVEGEDDNITYDPTVLDLVIEVTDDGDGTLTAAINTELSDTIAFSNTYTPDATGIVVTGTKTLTGRDIVDNEFSFVILDPEGEEAASGTNTGNSITFDRIEFTEAGRYTYTVSEVEGEDGNITYDPTDYTLVIDVTADSATGALTASINTELSDTIAFSNSYTPDATGIVVTGTKTLTGRDIVDSEFSFVILDSEGEEAASGTNTGNSITFDRIEFTEAGRYTYTVSEEDLGDKEITYDPTDLTLVIDVVADSATGVLTASINTELSDTIAFNNTYTYIDDSAYVTLRGTKHLTGRKLAQGEFSFELKDSSGAPIETVTNDVDGNIVFSTIQFVNEGVNVYTVSEVIGGDSKITYDEEVYTVTITVTALPDGKLEATTVITNSAGEESPILFTNKYKNDQPTDPINADTTVTVKKEIKDNTGDGYRLDGFVFQLTNLTTGVTQTAVSDASGYATFNLSYSYNEVGSSYDYIVTEMNTGITGMEYDSSVYSFNVKVNFIPPIFKAMAHITQNGANVIGPVGVFVNTYNGIEQIDPPDEDDDPAEAAVEEEE